MSDLSDYDYELPPELIAQFPLPARADARLMHVDRRRRAISHHHVRDFPDLLGPNDCLVFNDTRVVAARLLGRRATTGGRWEGLFLEEPRPGLCKLLGKSRGRIRECESIVLVDRAGRDDREIVLVAREDDGILLAALVPPESVWALLDRVGRVPLPHYVRHGEMMPLDRERYQTVYARHPGAVAAPTAGLHFTEELLSRIRARGVRTAWVTLHVGLGTFRPITAGRLEEHAMHGESGWIDNAAVETIAAARREGGRVVAIGTTSLRVLETAARSGDLQPWSGVTDLFIRPPFRFHAADSLFTNFHLPRTTLLVLARTFGGDALLQSAYREAIRERYRFFSYGDAMWIV